MFGAQAWLLGGVAAVALAFGAGWMLRGDVQNSGLGKNMVRELAAEREVAIRREVNLWTQIGEERRARVELIGALQKVDQVSAEARSAMLKEFAREKDQAAASEADAARTIEELKNVATDMAAEWKRGVVPDDIVCGVHHGSGCPAPAYPAAGADRVDGVAVRDRGPDPGQVAAH